MAGILFDDKSKKPDQKSLVKALGQTGKYWIELKKHIDEKYGPVIEDWKFYGQKYGWQLKVLRKKRNLFFIIPAEGYFKIVFVFGDKAVSAVEQSDLPEGIINTLKNAKKYMEGRGLQVEVKLPKDLKNVKKLVDIKVEN